MKSRTLFPVLMAGLFAALTIPVLLLGQEQNSQLPRYTVTDLGTLGGTYSYGYGVNSAGVVSGGSATASQTGGISQTAFLWYGGHILNLGTLGGTACPDCNSEAGGPNASGESPILSETAETDPNGEDSCGFGTHRQCLAAIWENGVMRALPNLKGGNNGAAFWENNLGEVAGWAENGVADPTCVAPYQVLRFESVVWGPGGNVRELRPLKGDTVGFALGINESGQAVGVSGLCSDTAIPPNITPGANAPHGVLWEKDGTPVDLGSLGGGPFTIPAAINDLGVVGGASLSSIDGTVHPFLWSKQGGIKDLGTFPGAIVTGIPCCHTLNNKGDAVGLTVDGNTFNMRAFLWHHNTLLDLNTLIPPDSGWALQQAFSISDRGEIVGVGTINGETHAFLAIPTHPEVGSEGAGASPVRR